MNRNQQRKLKRSRQVIREEDSKQQTSGDQLKSISRKEQAAESNYAGKSRREKRIDHWVQHHSSHQYLKKNKTGRMKVTLIGLQEQREEVKTMSTDKSGNFAVKKNIEIK